jgi:hypothetical protein
MKSKTKVSGGAQATQRAARQLAALVSVWL